MNAPQSAITLEKPSLQLLAIDALVASSSHVQEIRRSRFVDKETKELADDISRNGMLHQPIVRPIAGGKFEIVTGERRWLAAKLLGMKEIFVNVRELYDDQALEMQLSENLRRRDLHELEEAEGYEELMKLKGINADAVADLVGRSKSYVFKRTKLLALCPEARKAFYAGEVDASKALLVARISHHETQGQALKDIMLGAEQWGGRRPNKPMTFREAQQHLLQHYMLKLKAAPFDPNDAELLPKAGSCTACPKRTGNQTDLFGDVKDKDTCTDAGCYDEKRQATFALQRRRLEDDGKKVIHGAEAKKLLPHWDGHEHIRKELKGGYVPLDQTTYAAGRGQSVKALLGDDYEPILIQHPGTGEVLKVATQQAIAGAAGKKKGGAKPITSGSFNYKAAEQRVKDKGPDVDEQEFEALVKLIHEKAPKHFGKKELLVMARRLMGVCNARRYGEEAIAKAWGWPKSAMRGGGYYEHRLPAQVLKLDERGITLFMFDVLFATCYSTERKPMLELFGVSESKVREQVIEKRKEAAAAARAARALKKASKPKAAKPARAKKSKKAK